MDKTTKAREFRQIFQDALKINARSMSVKTLLSERNLKRIDYSPYYQRNYVWDGPKQTFFIESVILGTEIPPLIMFKSGAKIEVIDGRQRFETLKRFKENQLVLTIEGLKELQILNKKSFNALTSINQDIFLDSNIRVYEFEIINQPSLGEDIIDRVKKEIFRRYNTGITPLKREELDNAKYDEDAYSEFFRDKLKSTPQFYLDFNKCFFPKEDATTINDGVIAKNVDYIRRTRILHHFPITTYAGSERTKIIELLYDFADNNSEDPETEFNTVYETLLQVLAIHKDMSKDPMLSNKLIYGCILWAIMILKQENIHFEYKPETFKRHYQKSIANYSEDNSHYYGSIIQRFNNTAVFFSQQFHFDFSLYIRNEHFKEHVSDLRQTDVDAAKSIEILANLRLHKPNPQSKPIDEIRSDLKTSRFLVRPSYQRQEKISEIKASSIIESILLGINLPPIFVYSREDGTKEIVDGQQRLLAIIGFLGEQFSNENGKLTFSKNSNFKLRQLKILTDLEGRNFSSLGATLQDKILDFVMDLIMIEESMNKEFDPVDLFIRLNYKPYPIKNNSFEMWNSIVNYEVIKKIKHEVDLYRDWFFLREKIEGKPDRMENEEMVTILSYICFNNLDTTRDEVIGFFPRQDRITCRLKNKKSLGDFLVNLDNVETEKNEFLDCIEKSKNIIAKISTLFNDQPTKEKINDFFNVKNSQTFRRSLQDFYVMWLVLDKMPEAKMDSLKNILLDEIKSLLCLLKNVSNEEVDAHYLDRFKTELNRVIALGK